MMVLVACAADLPKYRHGGYTSALQLHRARATINGYKTLMHRWRRWNFKSSEDTLLRNENGGPGEESLSQR
jgi:hypothetical protein